jgi:hypothetical protein
MATKEGIATTIPLKINASDFRSKDRAFRGGFLRELSPQDSK